MLENLIKTKIKIESRLHFIDIHDETVKHN